MNYQDELLSETVTLGMKLANAIYRPQHRPDAVDTLNCHALRKWKAAFGHRPRVILDAWLLIENRSREMYKKKHIFWALYFMKNYTSEDSLAGKFNTTSKTFREKVRGILKLLATQSGVKVRINVKVCSSSFT
jgi:hypothetical protein